MIKTPLRYPGGKSKAINKIAPLIPYFSEFREPFVGGGSLYIYSKQLYPTREYWINDLNNDLYHFWQELKDNPQELISSIQHIKDITKDGKKLFKGFIENHKSKSGLEKAIRFFVLNRITFSGTVDSGGYSEGAFLKRFTQSSINRLKELSPTLQKTKITNHDYEQILREPGKNVFIFLDPPYLSATKSRLYGKNGHLHLSFDHERFAKVMKEIDHKWMITYDDCPKIRKLFSFANIISWEFQYGMNNYKQGMAEKGKELIITNYDPNHIQSLLNGRQAALVFG